MANLIEYKCPCCGGAIEFDSSLQKMKCPYCDTEFEMETLKNYDEELKAQKPDDLTWEKKAGSEWSAEDEDSLISYICNSCGGEILTDKTTAATHCPFCGNPVFSTFQLCLQFKEVLVGFQIRIVFGNHKESSDCR